MGITVPSPVLWTGSVYFGINANVNTQVSLTGRGSSQSTTQSGGAVCQGCVNVQKLLVSNASHSLENSKLGDTGISGSFGIIRACQVGNLSLSSSVSRICSSSASETSISGSTSKIVGLSTGGLSISGSSCDIVGASTSELSCDDSDLRAYKVSGSSCSIDGTSFAKIHNSSLDTLSVSGSQSFLSNVSCKTLSVGSKSSVDIKDCVALAITNAGFLSIACGTTLALQNSGVVWGALSNLGAISNSTVLFAYQSMCMGLGNSGVVKAWNTAGGILTWTADGEGAVGNSTFDDFGWLPSDPPPGGGSGTGGGGGSGGGGGGGTGGGTSYGGGPVTQDELATLNTALCGQISTLQNSVTSQVASLSAGITATHEEYIAGIGTVREDLVTGLDGLEHNLTSGLDVVQQDLVNGLAEVGSNIQQVDTDFRTRVVDARVEYVSPRQIGLTTQTFGLVGAVWVNGELIIADNSVDVFNTCPVLDWNYRTNEIVSSYLQPDTEYYIYLANHESSEFNVGAVTGTTEHPSTNEWDFRGRLFLSTTPDIDGFFSNFGAGLNARIVGSLKTDSSPYNTYNDRYPTPDCGPFFLQEVDISWIAKKTSYPETYREFSDFTLFYKDQNTLELKLVDGLYGQIFVGGNLHVFENNQQITRTSFRIIWNETNINIDSKIIELDETEILPLTEYFIYVTNDLDIWNFNEINPNTQRPWQEFDSYAQLFYDSEYDLRKSLILSTKEPEYGVMSQQWPGYCSRYIGSVSTDNYKYFIYKSTISAIRSLQLNPTYLDGLAEIEIQNVVTTEFKIVRKRGTSGIVMVGGRGVPTYNIDNPLVHTITTSDIIYTYNEQGIYFDPMAPLTDVKTITLTTTTMKANNAPAPYVASADTEYSSTYAAWRAFSKTNLGEYDTWVSSNTSLPHYITYYFGGNSVVIDQYAIQARNNNDSGYYFPSSFTLQGSNNGTSFTIIDTQTGILHPGINAWTNNFITSNTTSYKYYRLHVTAISGGSNYVCIGNLKLLDIGTNQTKLDIYIGIEKYLYLANDNDCWGSLKNKTFLCDIEPTIDAYLSQNFPGNTARWICNVKVNVGTKGTECITNGEFTTTSGWVSGGWVRSLANLNMVHSAGNTTSLEQTAMTVTPKYNHELTFTVSGMTTGQSITPQLGGVYGVPVTTSGTFTQYILPTSADVLKFIPTGACTAAIDSVTCKRVINNGIFAGSYITDSITGRQSEIDDSVVATDSTWSSQKLNILIGNLQSQLNASVTFGIQKDNGLDVVLEYVNTTTVRLRAVTADVAVAFPDSQARTITTTGITLPVSGSANVRYYVYLRHTINDGVELYMSTSKPDNLYAKLETLGTDSVQFGDICMTSSGTMSGEWNVCSSHNEQTKQWTTPLSSSSASLTLPGVVVGKRMSGLADRTGTTQGLVRPCVYNPTYGITTCVAPCYTAEIKSGTSSITCSYSATWATATLTVTVPGMGQLTEGINNIALTYSESISGGQNTNASQWEIYSRTGSLIVTRQ